MNFVLIYFCIKYKGYFHDIYDAIKSKEYIPLTELEEIKLSVDSGEIQAITIVDDDYPDSLKLINNPPFVLFYKGNKNLLKRKGLILTGDYSNNSINKFINESVEEIGKEHVLITNLSLGLDEEIVNTFTDKGKEIIFISSNGINNPYFINDIKWENRNQEKNLLISEYPDNVNINKKRLSQRNRIAIGLSRALVLASSIKKSKALSLVSYALEQGKDVFCYPGLQNEHDGNNLLIQDGAIMITSIKNKI